MSRLLRNKRKIFKILLTLAFFIKCSRLLNIKWFIIIIVVIGIIIYLMGNRLVHDKCNQIRAPFSVHSSIRNVDCLIIGGMCKAEEFIISGQSYVQIAAPDRGYNSAFEILKHTHSILREGGTIIMAVNKDTNSFSIFDVPFFHQITINKYMLENLRRKYNHALVFAPISSLRFLLGGGYAAYALSQNITEELNEFCKERGYNLIYMEKI